MQSPSLPPCKYGSKCYRKNLAHLAQYSHPSSAAAGHTKRERQDSVGDSEPTSKRRRNDSCSDASLSADPIVPTATGESQTSEDSGAPATQSCQEEAAAAPTTAAAAACGGDDELDDSGDDNASEERDEPVDFKSCPHYTPGDAASRNEIADWLKNVYGQSFPDDFFHLWDICSARCIEPKDALRLLLGVQLVGPYDFLAGLFADDALFTAKSVHLHSRYYYDPPEFMTVLAMKRGSLQHWGYFRDSPDDQPEFVAANDAQPGGPIVPVASNIVATVVDLCEKALSKSNDKTEITRLKKLLAEIERHAQENSYSIDRKSVDRARSRKVVARPLNRIGIVVPYDKKQDVGYRPLPMSNGKLKTLLDKIAAATSRAEREKYSDDLQEMVTFIQFANDECDYGMGLELGVDLFAHGSPVFHSMMRHLLPTAYDLLGRDLFAKIVRLHISNRKHLPGVIPS